MDYMQMTCHLIYGTWASVDFGNMSVLRISPFGVLSDDLNFSISLFNQCKLEHN
jgi:hypothetical protein